MTSPQSGEIWKYHYERDCDDVPEHSETWLIIDNFKVNERITTALCYTGLCLESGEVDNFFYGERTAPYWTRLA